MGEAPSRRDIVKAGGGSLAVAALVAACPSLVRAAPGMVRVVIWDEQQPAQKEAYDNFIGNYIAGYLQKRDGLAVRSVRLADPQQGLAKDTLDQCDVLIWWGHLRHREIKPATALDIVRRIKDGKLALLALHSAHWSAPFVEAMYERAREDVLKKLAEPERASARINEIVSKPFTPPKYDDALTPSSRLRKKPDGPVEITLTLPNCCFPAYRADGKPSHVRVQLPDHPIVKGVAARFTIPHTEMYDEPFHVPDPDAVVLEERWETGEWFRSGCVWQVGKGKVFYFRPGHETYAVYKEADVLKIIENAARWLGSGGKG
jgi:trehalose utilization protein